jgi:hypothetical protein
MATPQPDKKRIDNLLGRVQSLILLDALDELEFKRVEIEADEFLRIPVLESVGYVVFGTLASLKLDVKKVKEYFKVALQTAPPESIPYVKDSFILALQRVYHFNEAADLAILTHNENRDNLPALNRAISTASASMRLSDVKVLLEHSVKLNHDPYSAPDFQRNGNDLQEPSMELLKKFDLKESVITDRIETAGKYLLSKNIISRGSMMNHLRSGEISYQFILPVTSKEAAELSFDLALALIEEFDNPLSEILTISCIPYEHIS